MLQDLNTSVIQSIKTSNPAVIEAVKTRLVAQEVDRRVNALVKAIEAVNALEKEGQKIKPDIITYASDKSVQSEGWSKGKLEERDKHDKKLAKLRQAIEKALDVGDYSQLLNPQKDGEKQDESAAA